MASNQDPATLDFFWDCLQSSDAVDSDLIEELRGMWTPDAWRPVGEILIRKKTLTLRQVAGLIGMQASEPHMRIGDLAVREGLCTVEEIQAALAEQRASCPGPIELLVQDERVEGEELFDALLKYARFLEGRLRRYQSEAKNSREHSHSVP